MTIRQIMEAARAIIYASAIGIIIHMAGAILHEAPGTGAMGQGLVNSIIVSVAILFVVMDGITRYFVRTIDEADPILAPALAGLRFLLEVVGLFSFCYWVSVVLATGSFVGGESRIYLAAFALSAFLHNFLSFLLGMIKYNPTLARPSRFYGFWPALLSYFKTILAKDVLEERLPTEGGTLMAEGFSFLKRNKKDLLQQMASGEMGSFGKCAIKSAGIRMEAQVKVIHVGVFHIVMFFLLFLSNRHEFDALRQIHYRLEASDAETIILLFIIPTITAVVSYMITSMCEYERNLKSPLSKPTRIERFMQAAGNNSMLVIFLLVIWFAPLWAIYVIYFSMMTFTIGSILMEIRRDTPRPLWAHPTSY